MSPLRLELKDGSPIGAIEGKGERGWLGVSLGFADKATAEELGADPMKAIIAYSVAKSSPSEKAGLLAGDVFLKVNGEAIASVEQLLKIVGELRAGSAVSLDILRGGKPISLSLAIEVRNEGLAAEGGNYFPGLVPVSLDSESVDRAKLPQGARGVFVSSVGDKSPAAKVGIAAGDIVTKVNDRPISSVMEFYAAMNDPGAKKLAFTVNRGGQAVSTIAYERGQPAAAPVATNALGVDASTLSLAASVPASTLSDLPETKDLLFPVDGVTLGKTTKTELSKLGKKGSGSYAREYCVVKGYNVWFFKEKLAEQIYIVRNVYPIPEKWQALGMDYHRSYNDWIALARGAGWLVSVPEQPHLTEAKGVSTFNAKVKCYYRAGGLLYSVELQFDLGTGKTGSDQDTLYSVRVRFEP